MGEAVAPRTARLEAMVTAVLTRQFERLRDWIVSPLTRTRIRPNTLTFLGLCLNVPVALLIGTGQLRLGAVAFLVASFFDVLDGAVAKRANRVTRFGAFFDSTMDRISDMFLFGGVAWYLKDQEPWGKGFALLALVALAFSLLISYTRARAESIIPSCQVGFAERPERIIILVAACFLRSLRPAVCVLVVITCLTFIHRVIYTWYRTNDRAFPGSLRAGFLDFPRGSLGYDAVFLIIAIALIVGDRW
jgi:CDP-diacylglycerol--glycerol-3-phosphate 3-phosphatidyltransferase